MARVDLGSRRSEISDLGRPCDGGIGTGKALADAMIVLLCRLVTPTQFKRHQRQPRLLRSRLDRKVRDIRRKSNVIRA
jgi:hypothetical protein